MNYPDMALMRQHFDAHCIDDIPAAVRSELERIEIASLITAGQTVGISAGSRGIANIAATIRGVVDFVSACGGKPFIFPAMGSHAGAQAAAQAELLGTFGITEKRMGCPIRSTMEVVEIGRNPDGLPVFLDRHAHAADHLIVVNRVKPHTKFEGSIESGLLKMMAIGMGKHHGARLYHQASVRYGMQRVIESAGRVVMDHCPVLCGLAVVENGYEQTAILRAVRPADLIREEETLLVEARRRMAKIPFPEIDLLIVDEIGKNISGTGMDTNVTGVNRDILGTFSSEPRTKRLFVRDLTPETQGNALGIGFADFTTTRLVNKIDRQKTYINCLTGISPEKGAIPIYFDTDRECIDAAVGCLGMVARKDLRVVHIRNTRSLEWLSVSRAYAAQIEEQPHLEVISGWQPLTFGSDQQLVSPFSDAENGRT